MNRAILLYVVLLVAGVAAVAAVLSAGRSLKAPPDLSGTWELDRPAGAPEAGVAAWRIEQSGRYLRLSRPGGEPADYGLESFEIANGERHLRLVGATDSIEIVLNDSGGQMRIEGDERLGSAAASATLRRVSGIAINGGSSQDGPSGRSKSGAGRHVILILLVQIAIILLVSQIIGALFERISQPRVMGEMVAGIMLGPSLLGWLWPGASATIFAAESIPLLNVLSQVGVVFFLFLIGLELDPKLLKNRGQAALIVSHASITTPFVLGALLTLFLYPRVFNDTSAMRFSSAALFMGAAMSITAFPVLARILTERNLHKSPVGALSITCAAINDVTAWCILPFIVAFARASGVGSAAATAGFSALYIGAVLLLVRPLLVRLERMHERQGGLSRGIVGFIFLLVLISASITEMIGIHALFGAFMMGAVMPKNSRFVRELNDKLEDFIVVVLLPVFFAYTGLKTQIGLLNSGSLWMITALIVVVACAGKFGGSALAARACGMNWRESSAIGVLMNTRGLMELVILNIGRELGVITDAVFAMMVLMAIATTFLTTPVLNWVYPDRLLRWARPRDAKAADTFGILIPVSLPRSARPLARIADVLSGPDDARRRVIGLHLDRAEEHEAYRAAIDSEATDYKEPLLELCRQGTELGVPIEPITLVSRDPAGDIARVAQEQQVRLVLMGFHNPVIGQTFLGGTVHRVLEEATTDVAIFIDRGLHDRPKRILVPYLGSPHDRLALEMAARMGQHAGAAVTVLHIVGPDRARAGAGGPRLGAKTVTEQTFADPTQPAPVEFRVVEHTDPIAAVLEQAKTFDLVVLGIAEEWGLTSQLFGWRAERIARDCPSPLLIMRKYVPAQGASGDAGGAAPPSGT